MYLDFNGRRIELEKKAVATLAAVAVFVVALVVFSVWPRQGAVVSNQYRAPVPSVASPSNLPPADNYDEVREYMRQHGGVPPPRDQRCTPNGVYVEQLGRCVPRSEQGAFSEETERRLRNLSALMRACTSQGGDWQNNYCCKPPFHWDAEEQMCIRR